MEVLIIERDALIGDLLVDTLGSEGVSVAVASDEDALKLLASNVPRVVITSINRVHDEDMAGPRLVAVMRRSWPQRCAVYLLLCCRCACALTPCVRMVVARIG